MNTNCQYIIFSDKAYNAIINETFKKDPLETGGILLGHILNNGIWVVMEVLPPGWNSTFQYAYFEYDERFVNYMAHSVATEYEQELSLLGLWHRHPGSMDTFSGTDDGTNRTFAGLNSKGAISGLVNVDPKFRLTMYHVSTPLHYEKVAVEVGNDLIPEEYFKLKHFPKKGLNPDPPEKKNGRTSTVREYERDLENNYVEDDFWSRIMRYLDSKFLFLLIFVVGVALSLFSLYSYNQLKETDDIKSLYKVFYANTNAILVPDSVSKAERGTATNKFDKEKVPKLRDSLDATAILLRDKRSEYEAFCQSDTVKKDSTTLVENFKKYLFTDSINKYCAEHNIDTSVIILTTDSLIKKVYVPAFVEKEIQTRRTAFIAGWMKHFPERYAAENNDLIIVSAGDQVWYVIILLLLFTELSMFVAVIPKKKKLIIQWLIVVSLLIISAGVVSALNYKFGLLNPFSLSYFIAIVAGFTILSFITFIVMWVFNSFNFSISRDTRYWYQKYPNLYMYEEQQIKQRFADAEKHVENGTVSFFIKTFKQIENKTEPLAFQLVYSFDYDKSKDIKVYLLNPDFDELSNKSKNFPNVEIDSAGESYLALSKTIKKDKVSGMEIINKLYEWIQLYVTKK